MTEEQQLAITKLTQAVTRGEISSEVFAAEMARLMAVNTGSGAVAQNGGTAVGAGGVRLGGNNSGDINTGLIINMGTQPGASKDAMRCAYLARILNQADQLPLFASDDASASLRLSSVYTALRVGSGDKDDQIELENAGTREKHDERNLLSALDMLNKTKKLVLLGGPGSGKSAFVNFVSLCMAGEMLGHAAINLQTLVMPVPPEEDERRDNPKPQNWTHGALLPVRIILRDLAADLPDPDAAVSADTIWKYIVKQLELASLADYEPHLRAELMQQGGLILLDGLDEVPDADSRRTQIKTAVQDFADTFHRCRFLVTSRTYAYQNQKWKLKGFEAATLRWFLPGQINRFADAWFAHLAGLSRLTQGDAGNRAELLKTAIRRNERLAVLAKRPLLLTLMAKLQTERGNQPLPEKREELYAQAVDLLLNQWESLKTRATPGAGRKIIEPSLSEWLKTSRDDIRRELDKLAFTAHRDQPKLVGTADIPEQNLINALLAASKNRDDVMPLRLRDYLQDRAGLLASHGNGLYQFPHRSFQEYLAACHLTVEGYPDVLSDLTKRAPDRWRESALLAAAKAGRGSPSSVWMLVDALLPPDEPPQHGAGVQDEDLWGALMAGQILWETGLAEPGADNAPRNEKKRGRAQTWMRAIVQRGWHTPLERALAGQVLSVMGDDRDFDELVFISADAFWMGDDRKDSNAYPKQRVSLPAFKIAKYPTTNVQYQAFVKDKGRVWYSRDAGKPEKRNCPAHSMTWHDAMAYCEWLTQIWRRAGRITPLEKVTLPSEAEWERAARFTDGREYPWGKWKEGCANTAEAGLEDTCVVGMFAKGCAQEGCHDMAGNVWEWTRSWYRPYDKKHDAGRNDLAAQKDDKYRVLRGGSWGSLHNLARCAVRGVNLPVFHNDFIGFRVMVAPV